VGNRPVNRVDQRIQEAEKLGFSTIFVSKYNKIALKNTGIKIQLVAKIRCGEYVVWINALIDR
jgi:DNA repair protein RadA/Sms